jgi:hypothetical protein
MFFMSYIKYTYGECENILRYIFILSAEEILSIFSFLCNFTIPPRDIERGRELKKVRAFKRLLKHKTFGGVF